VYHLPYVSRTAHKHLIYEHSGATIYIIYIQQMPLFNLMSFKLLPFRSNIRHCVRSRSLTRSAYITPQSIDTIPYQTKLNEKSRDNSHGIVPQHPAAHATLRFTVAQTSQQSATQTCLHVCTTHCWVANILISFHLTWPRLPLCRALRCSAVCNYL
jgi:hypothetical protein